MDPLDIFKLIAATGLAGVITSFIGQLYQIYRKKSKPQETTEDRVQRLTKSLNEATALINNIESEIKARSELATQLQNDLDQYNKLVELKKPEVEAIAQLLRGELKKEGRSTFWKGVLINFVFFILGAAASLVITQFVK